MNHRPKRVSWIFVEPLDGAYGPAAVATDIAARSIHIDDTATVTRLRPGHIVVA